MHVFTSKPKYERKPEPYVQGLCKDCKKPTPTYRCPACKEKHLKKHRGNMDGFAADENVFGAALMAYVKRPNGFRAVRMRGKTEVVYCVEHDKQVDVFEECGKWKTFTANEFSATHAREYSPMPDAVRDMFQGKPSFAEWWDGRQAQP